MTALVTTPSTLQEMKDLYEQTTRNMESDEIVLVESGDPLPKEASARIRCAREVLDRIKSETELFRALESDAGSGSGN